MKRYNEQEMSRLYAKWQQSGKTKILFCKEEGIKKTTFYYWVKKFQDAKPSRQSNRVGFTPIVLKQNSSLAEERIVFRIKYSSGACIDFFDSADAEFIKSLCR